MLTTSTPHEFWKARLLQAVERAEAAPSERSRAAYLELARHYWSMHELINGPGRVAADPAPSGVSATEHVAASNYGSVHDALMQAA